MIYEVERMKNTIFKGVGTAIVTPLNENGIDFDKFAKLVEWQIAEGVNSIIVCGTTGESATLSDAEHKVAIKFMVDQVNGRIPVVAGTGSNDTEYAKELSKYACEVGADGLLVVTPYYNKATQKGLVKHFTEVADVSTKPIILYSVASRTGCNINPATCLELADHPNISAIKEASGNISQIADIAALVGDKMDIYSGNDDQIVPVLSLGGKGVISVLSNIMPKKTVEICDRFFAKDIEGSAKLQLELLPLIHALFSEVNPIPVKAGMAAMDFCEDYLRMPLTPMEDANKAVLLKLMKEQNLI